MTTGLIALIPAFAREKGIELSPSWHGEAVEDENFDHRDGLRNLSQLAGWAPPEQLKARPRADQFPLLVYSIDQGWAIAEQWENHSDIRDRKSVV